eukprot:scaffold1459_cov260-Pinguiococcus_pyrenoidosus.AAC.27
MAPGRPPPPTYPGRRRAVGSCRSWTQRHTSPSPLGPGPRRSSARRCTRQRCTPAWRQGREIGCSRRVWAYRAADHLQAKAGEEAQ